MDDGWRFVRRDQELLRSDLMACGRTVRLYGVSDECRKSPLPRETSEIAFFSLKKVKMGCLSFILGCGRGEGVDFRPDAYACVGGGDAAAAATVFLHNARRDPIIFPPPQQFYNRQLINVSWQNKLLALALLNLR